MLTLVQIALLVVGGVLLVVGYRRDRRRMLATAAMVLLLAGTVPDFVDGLQQGYAASQGHVAG